MSIVAPEQGRQQVIETLLSDALFGRVGSPITRKQVGDRRARILWRYYFSPDKPTYATIGQEFGVTAVRIDQIIGDSLRYLRPHRELRAALANTPLARDLWGEGRQS